MGLAVADLAIDGVAPRTIVRATSETDVVAAIRAANDAREAIVIWGGGTRIGVGDPPLGYDVALDLAELRGVVRYEPDDLVITVRAGTTLAELAQVLAEHGQRWPVEAAHPERATVGGTIAGAAHGPSRLRSFHPRDWAIGCRAVLGDGTPTKAGGNVVKNVTGYDLTRLYSGSYGTLCALVEVTLKLVPLPEREITLRADLPDAAAAYDEAARLRESGLPLDALVLTLFGAARAPSAFVRLAGTGAAVERLRGEVRRRHAFAEADPAIWAAVADPAGDEPVHLRLTVAHEDRLRCDESAVVLPGTGVTHVVGDIDAEAVLAYRARAEALGGAAVLERAPSELRRAVGTWGTARSTPRAIARALKERFDPRDVLAPGRFAF